MRSRRTAQRWTRWTAICPIFIEMRAKTKVRSSIPTGELALLNRIRARAGKTGGTGVRLGIGDDCALLRTQAGEELAVTTDLSIEAQHFRLEWHPPEVVGHRALARGLSDLAAMGARPVAAFLSLGLPPELVQNTKARSASWQASWIARFYDGFLALAEQFKTPLAGGDLAQSPIAVADIVLIGAVRSTRALLRSGARPGDWLYLTGKLGGAAAGLARLAEFAASASGNTSQSVGRFGLKIPHKLRSALEAHFYPQPRLAQGLWLVKHGLAAAGLDVSDGLSTDLNHLCEESAVAAEVEAATLPVYPGATLDQALNGGEDYELLFAARPDSRIPRAIAGVPVTRIGRVVRRHAGKPAVTLVTKDGARPLEPRGWQHFL
ncbi:MAG TPA: thiamine-phosphate kinase [Terracidiphilus sp.]|nr:thiamine-phosphate kinase [Terracidiphilus sp.]